MTKLRYLCEENDSVIINTLLLILIGLVWEVESYPLLLSE